EHAPGPEPVELVETAVDVGPGALRQPQELAASERVRRLHADEHGELPGPDHRPRLAGAVDEPEPAATRAAALRVDVSLQRPQPGDLQLHGLGLVAGVRPERFQLAER